MLLCTYNEVGMHFRFCAVTCLGPDSIPLVHMIAETPGLGTMNQNAGYTAQDSKSRGWNKEGGIDPPTLVALLLLSLWAVVCRADARWAITFPVVRSAVKEPWGNEGGGRAKLSA